MLIRAGDPRDLLPVERLRREILGTEDDPSQDAQLLDHLRAAADEVSARLGARVLDGDREFRATRLAPTEVVRLNARWVRALAGIQWIDPATHQSGGQVGVGGLVSRRDRAGISIHPPSAEGWPSDRLAVTLSLGLDLADEGLALVRQVCVLYARAYFEGYRERRPTNAMRDMLSTIRREAWAPGVTADSDLREDDFGQDAEYPYPGYSRPRSR